MNIQELEKKFSVLRSLIVTIKAENTLLKNKLTTSENKLKTTEQTINNYQTEINDLKNQIKILKLATALKNEEQGSDSILLKRKINEYIKDIDYTIAVLKGEI